MFTILQFKPAAGYRGSKEQQLCQRWRHCQAT